MIKFISSLTEENLPPLLMGVRFALIENPGFGRRDAFVGSYMTV